MGTPSRSSGVAKTVRWRTPPAAWRPTLGESASAATDVLDVDRPPLEHRPPLTVPRLDREGPAIARIAAAGHARDQPEILALQTEDVGIGRPADPGGILGHDLHDRLQVGRRARDHAQDLARRRLLLERLRQLAVPRSSS